MIHIYQFFPLSSGKNAVFRLPNREFKTVNFNGCISLLADLVSKMADDDEVGLKWDDYISTQLLDSGKVKQAAILSRADGAVWAASPGFAVSDYFPSPFLLPLCVRLTIYYCT